MNNQPDSWSEGSSYCRYDRSERLKRAPEAVQQMYEPDYIKKMSLIKSLTATRSSRSMLFAIVAVFALTFASFLLKTDRQSGKILGIPTKLEYLTQQDYLYVNISLEQRSSARTMPCRLRSALPQQIAIQNRKKPKRSKPFISAAR